MITVAEVDRLVVADDAVAARLWLRLGPRVRSAYLADRDRWIGLRRSVEGGATLSTSTLAAQRKAFAGWARAFSAAGRPRPAPTAKRKAVADLYLGSKQSKVVASRGGIAGPVVIAALGVLGLAHFGRRGGPT